LKNRIQKIKILNREKKSWYQKKEICIQERKKMVLGKEHPVSEERNPDTKRKILCTKKIKPISAKANLVSENKNSYTGPKNLYTEKLF
jgi:hypothetical protein